ncbi:MAG: hypothetical protein D6824_04155 [Planctomycetota bacterium]|nr:MAG: hypothetical protein D6824_04155 [Planctomycetota bacterium]
MLALSAAAAPSWAAVPVVREMALDPATGVLSAWLANGLRVHHRASSFRKGQIALSLTFARGRLDQPQPSSAALDAAMQGLVESLRRRLQPRQPAQGEQVDVQEPGFVVFGWVEPHAAVLELLGPAEQTSDALTLLASELLEPTFTDADLARALQRQQQRLRDRAAFRALWSAIPQALYPPRQAAALRRPAPSALASVRVEAARRQLRDLADHAPVELAVTGDITRAAALEALARTLGRLPQRPRVVDASAAHPPIVRRALQAPVTLHSPSTSPEALVWASIATQRALEGASDAELDAAAVLLELQGQRTFSEQLSHGARVRAYHRSLAAPFAQGSLSLYASAPPAAARTAAALLARVFRTALEEPVDEAAFRQALRQRAEEREKSLRDPHTWARFLASMDLRRRDLHAFASSADALRAVSLDAVKRALRQALDASPPAIIVVLPAKDEEKD